MGARFALFLLAALLINGCASSNPYKMPQADPSELATIRGHAIRTGLVNWENYWVDLIDNQSISYAFRSFESYEIPVTPVEHSFVVFTEFNRGGWFGPCPCQAFLQIVATLQAGRAYKLNGRVDGVVVEIWIEDIESGERISGSSSSPYRPSPRDVYIPILL